MESVLEKKDIWETSGVSQEPTAVVDETAPSEEIFEEMETLADIYDEFGNVIRKSKETALVEQVDEDLGQESLFQAEELIRQRELEKQAEPLIEERVSEAVMQHNARLKREAAELIYEHDTTILDNVRQARLEDRKERKRQRRIAKVKSFIGFLLIGGILVVFCTNSQVKPLVNTLFTNLYEMAVDLINNEETDSNAVVDDSLEELGDLLNKANTKVIVVEENN